MSAGLRRARKLSIIRGMRSMIVAECGGAVCSWCGGWLGLRRNLPCGEITDGICGPCQERMLDFSTDGDSLTSLAESPGCKSGGAVSSSPTPLIAGAMSARPSDIFDREPLFVGSMQEVPA